MLLVIVMVLVSSKLVLLSVSLVKVRTVGCHLSWFPTGREDGGPPLLDMDIQSVQLFWFPLIRQNSWEP